MSRCRNKLGNKFIAYENEMQYTTREDDIMLQSQFEHKMISRGVNFPDFDFTKDNLDRICIGLHLGYSEEQLMKELSISQAQWKKSIDLLYGEGLAKKVEGRYVPTFPVISHEAGQQFYQLSIAIGNDIVSLINHNANRIQQETFKVPALHNFEFADLSLFIMSDVLLDFVQIDYVEQLFLKSDRPSRNGKNYYYGLLEKHADQQLEPFGIYGNHCVPIGSAYYCAYGNNRYNQPLLPLFSKEQVCTLFGPALSENKAAIPTIIDHIIQSSSGNGSIESEIRKGLGQLHLWKNGKLMIPVLNNEEYQALHRIANLITADLIRLFEDYRSMLVQAYHASPFAEETSFEEYFIWYYHFLYTYVTNQLIELNVIQLPSSNGLAHFILLEP
ncbi:MULTISPECIES: hypothetical protein [Paenibacillus]|uniref:Uncharacterized protein n=1 Tax=Paenibacillus alvei TaxID=44250 RepID=A0ABT4EA01_PAEAL|nr:MULTISPECIES: hypothetical protein [Paenibacillus]MCY9530455.1 hypothetical protein [Paenibacillus alvei]